MSRYTEFYIKTSIEMLVQAYFHGDLMRDMPFRVRYKLRHATPMRMQIYGAIKKEFGDAT